MGILLKREDFLRLLSSWYKAWNTHDLDEVMDLLHDDVMFIHWNGSVVSGKKTLRKAWASWFLNNGQFRFDEEETFIDDIAQKVLFRWTLEWPSTAEHIEGREKREGVDVLHFSDGKIIKKLTYSRTRIEINGGQYLMNV